MTRNCRSPKTWTPATTRRASPAITPQATKTPPERRLILHGGSTLRTLRGDRDGLPRKAPTHNERYGYLPTIRQLSIRLQAGAPLARLAQRDSKWQVNEDSAFGVRRAGIIDECGDLGQL